jgi:hypothetical protein
MKHFFYIVLLLGFQVHAASNLPDAKKIEELTHLQGKMDTSEGVFKVSFPRADIKSEADGVVLTPPMGLTAWAAFKRTSHGTMVMGDVVLTENQVNPVMDAALGSGLEVTALHNHFLWEQPRIMFMHIGAVGDEQKLATAVGEVFAKLKETPSPATQPKINPAESKLDTKKIAEILGQGELNGGVFKVTIGRTAKMHGQDIGKSMGVNTWAAFAGTDARAVVAGDFAMHEDELQPVLKALRGAGIQIVSIHNHMTMESPRIMFLHYWGTGPAEKLAHGVKGALKVQK